MARVALQQIQVVADLAHLAGPVAGLHRLPLRLDSSARTLWDFAEPLDRKLAYATVLREARSVNDLVSWLRADPLIELWPVLYLPREVRAEWQRQHRVLAERGAGPHVPAP